MGRKRGNHILERDLIVPDTLFSIRLPIRADASASPEPGGEVAGRDVNESYASIFISRKRGAGLWFMLPGMPHLRRSIHSRQQSQNESRAAPSDIV